MTTNSRESHPWVAWSAALVWLALGLQMFLQVRSALSRHASVAAAVLSYFVFISIIANLFAAIVLTAAAARGDSRFRRVLTRPDVATAVAAGILLVGLGYNALSRFHWHPRGLERVTDELLHVVVPATYVFYWWRTTARRLLRYRDVRRAAWYPVVYFTGAEVYGLMTGDYPYRIMDPGPQGYFPVVFHAVVATLVFVLIAMGLVRLNRRGATSSRPVSP